MIPQPGEQSNIVFWGQDVLNQIDSEFLKYAYGNTHAYYRSLFEHLIGGEQSPYKDSGVIEYGEFLWAFNIVSSRHVVLHEHEMDKDPNLLLLMTPLLDMLNHSPDPNVAVLPHRDSIENESFLVLHALKDIEPDEQLTINYGNLSNMHFIQKYGFVVSNSSQMNNNVLQGSLSFSEY